MSGNDGGLSPGERMDRLEQHQEAADREMTESASKLWKKINAMELQWAEKLNAVKIELAQSQIKLAVLIGVLCFVASVGAQLALKLFK